jgi:hypothetical protein
MSFTNEVVAYTFPAGRYRTVLIALSTAKALGNVELNLQPPIGCRWLVLSGKLIVELSADVANRYMRVFKMSGAEVIEELFQNTVAVTAGQGLNFNFGEITLFNGTSPTNTSGLTASVYTGIRNIVLNYPDFLRVGLLNGTINDTYYGFLTVLELSLVP